MKIGMRRSLWWSLIIIGGVAVSAIVRPIVQGLFFSKKFAASEIVEFVEKTNKTLPRMVDAKTRADAVHYYDDIDGKHLDFENTIMGVKKGQIDASALGNDVHRKTLRKYCTDTNPIDMPKNNVALAIYYSTESGDLITKVVLYPTDCLALTK